MHTDSPSPTESPFDGRRLLLAAVLLAGAVQIIMAARSPAIARDGITFVNLAREMTRRPVAAMREADQHPGYPAMILAGRPVATMLAGGDEIREWILAGRLVSGLCGMLTVALVWLMTRRAFDGRTAGVAAIVFAVLPAFRRNAADVLSDTPHLCFYLLAAWAMTEGWVRRRVLWFLLAGAASGAAYWIRPEGLGPAVVAVGALAGMAIRRTGGQRRFALLSAVAVLLCAGVVAAPYAAIKGRLTAKKDITHILDERGPKQEAQQAGPASSESKVIERVQGGQRRHAPLGRVLSRMVVAFCGELLQALRYMLVAPLVIGLAFSMARRPRSAASVLIWATVGLHLVLLVALFLISRYLSVRHVMPMVALLMPWVASGWDRLAAKLHSVLSSRSALAARLRPNHVLMSSLALFVLIMLPYVVRPLHAQRTELVRAAQWVRAHATEGDAVLSNSVYVPFYANTPGRVIERGELIGGIRTSAYRFVVLDRGAGGFQESWLADLKRSHGEVNEFGAAHERERTLLMVARQPERTSGGEAEHF